jgi:hypothetical protein
MSDEFWAILIAGAAVSYSIVWLTRTIRQMLAAIIDKQSKRNKILQGLDTRLSYIGLLMKDLPGIKEAEAKRPNPFFTIRPKADSPGDKS